MVINHPSPFSDLCMWAEFQPISILLEGFSRVLWFPPSSNIDSGRDGKPLPITDEDVFN